MAEAAIKRVNFFDGQFLKQGEFLDLEAYHRHMRRRTLYVLFDKSGVVQYGGTDLAIELVNVAGKIIRVKAGTALGRRDDLLEAKEIVLQADQDFDLNTITPPLGPGSTGIVTIHYAEQQTEPSSEGGVLGNTRVVEQAILTVHRRNTVGPELSSPTAPNGEPYVRLGNVTFDAVGISPPRDVAYLKSTLLAPAATIGISPNLVTAGGPVSLLLSSSGGLDLSTLVPGNINLPPMADISALAVPPASRTTNSAIVNFNVATLPTVGPRAFIVTIGAVSAQTTLTVQAGLQLSGFTGVNVPAADTTFEINGSGFVAPVVVEFTAPAPALWTPPVTLATVLPTTLQIPLASIPTAAIQGPVRVTSAGTTVVSAFSVTPPAVISAAEGGAYPPPGPATPITPNVVARGTHLRITGLRFYGGPPGPNLVVRIGTVYTTTAFPSVAVEETRSETVLKVWVPTSVPTGTRALTVETPGGGVVLAPLPLTVTIS